jgi:hypothetical protein
MPNLRIIYDNAADAGRPTTLAASTTAGTLAAANMQSDRKSMVHRSTGTSVSYTLTWANGESIGGVALPASNLSAEATIRVRLYSDTAGTALLADSGVLFACAGLNVEAWDWEGILNGNAFPFGALAKSAVWFANNWFAKCCVIDLADPTNPAGYIDNSRLVIGPTWSPIRNAKYGVQVLPFDRSDARRNDADDDIVDRRQQHDKLRLDLQYVPEADRAKLMQIIRNVGTSRKFFLSLTPGDASPVAEQDGMFYGRRANNPVTFDMPLAFSTTLDLEGW